MRYLSLVLPAILVAGCMGGEVGTFTLQLSDEPNAIGDFASLLVTFDRVVLTPAGGENDTDGRVELEPTDEAVDLTTLVGGNVTTLVSDEVAAGDYARIDLHVASVEGTLAEGGTADVSVPSDRLFLAMPFTVEAGGATEFLFDVVVVETGAGFYLIKPNAGASGVEGEGGGERDGRPDGAGPPGGP